MTYDTVRPETQYPQFPKVISALAPADRKLELTWAIILNNHNVFVMGSETETSRRNKKAMNSVTGAKKRNIVVARKEMNKGQAVWRVSAEQVLKIEGGGGEEEAAGPPQSRAFSSLLLLFFAPSMFPKQ